MSDAPRIHPTALVEDGVVIGPRTAIWDSVHVRAPAVIGHDCIVGEKTYVAYGVQIGDYVKVNAQVYICTGVTLEDRVFVAAGVVFTNDRFPRAFADEHEGLAPSEVSEDTLETVVRRGATLGARAVIGPGLEIGSYAMIGMGAVVVSDVPAHALAYGSPARVRGWVCVCGNPVVRGGERIESDGRQPRCERCGRRYHLSGSGSAARLAPEIG